MLDSLPDELIIDIIHRLDLLSALRCRQVYRRLGNIVKNSASLQYKNELTAAGMVDGSPGEDTIPTRLAMLKEYTAAWKEKEPNVLKLEPIKSPDYYGHKVVGGVVAYRSREQAVESDWKLNFVRLPSERRGILERRWTVSASDVKEYAIDPSQDLLVFVAILPGDGMQAGRSSVEIRLLSLASGKPHPSAVRSFLPCGTYNSREIILRISGDFICVWLGQHVKEHIATIWNWVSGDQRLRISAPPFHSVLLPSGHLLVASHQDPSPHIVVHDLHHNFPESPSHTFHFPSSYVAAGARIDELKSSEVPTWRLSTQFAGPFSTSPNSSLLFITFFCFSPRSAIPAGLQRKHKCIIPASTLLRHTRSDNVDVGASVPWATWGKDLLLVPLPIVNDCRSQFGMKALRVEMSDLTTTGAVELKVYDFNRIRFEASECATGLDDPNDDEDIAYPWGFRMGVFSNLRLPPFTTRIFKYRPGRPSLRLNPYFTEDGILLAYDNWFLGMTQPFVQHLEMLYF